jgi:hypothetical protein
MRENRKLAKKMGFDDVVSVFGKDENETFVISIQKI